MKYSLRCSMSFKKRQCVLVLLADFYDMLPDEPNLRRSGEWPFVEIRHGSVSWIRFSSEFHLTLSAHWNETETVWKQF